MGDPVVVLLNILVLIANLGVLGLAIKLYSEASKQYELRRIGK